MKILLLVCCLLVAVNAGTYGGQKIGLEDIERDYNPNYMQPKASSSAVSSPTKFGFVPKRTASSYAATKPKPQYLQTNYRVKQPSYQAQPVQYQQQFTTQYSPPQVALQYSTISNQQYTLPSTSSDYSELYSSGNQQYISQQQTQDYAYQQPEVQQQYVVQNQQPGQQYEEYEKLHYVTDNSLTKTDAQPQQFYSQAPQPQYYYVQQYSSPSTAIESVIDPKALQYAVNVPFYAPNSISIDQKQLEAYTNSDSQLPPVTTTVAKYTKVTPGKSTSSKQYVSQKDAQYVIPSAKTQQQKQDQILFNREPKSLLDSYVPSIVQLQYLKQQGKNGYSKF